MDTRLFTLRKFKSRENWKKARKIGGSDLGAIFGVNKWETSEEVVDRIKNGNETFKENARMVEGAKAEEFIRNLWQLEHPNYKVIAPPKNNWLFVKKYHPFMTVSPDAILNEDYSGALEIKDVEIYKKDVYEMWKSGNIPIQYFYQVMQYFVVINTLNEVYLVARLKIMFPAKLDHIEEISYHFTREEFKETIKECYEKERQFIKENFHGNKSIN